jgi:MFS family permease
MMVLPVALSAAFGYLIDRFGMRLLYVWIGSFSCLLGFLLLTYSKVNPIVGTLLESLSLTASPIGMISAIPYTVPITSVGTAYGIYKCVSNIGSTLSHQVIGILQDRNNDRYEYVMTYLVILSSISLCLSSALPLIDSKVYGGVLYKRQALNPPDCNEEEIRTRDDKRFKKYVFVYPFIILNVCSWIMLVSSFVRRPK